MYSIILSYLSRHFYINPFSGMETGAAGGLNPNLPIILLLIGSGIGKNSHFITWQKYKDKRI